MQRSRYCFSARKTNSNSFILNKENGDNQSNNENESYVVGVVAPLEYIGPYPCLKLRFPSMVSSNNIESSNSMHEEHNGGSDNGVVLDFVLDTGANMNSISKNSVNKLQLPLIAKSKDLSIAGSAGVGGLFQAGDLYQLGDCKLEGLPPEQSSLFMRNLTAFGLPHSCPVGNGLLGMPFFLSFPAGVEFDFNGTDGDPPTVIFYYGRQPLKEVLDGIVKVPVNILEPIYLISLKVNINGTEMLAIIDTGSPITIITPNAAKKAMIRIQEKQINDDELLIRGIDKKFMSLKRSSSEVPISVFSESNKTVSFGKGFVYVCELPGFDQMSNMSEQITLPDVVFGLDFLKRMYRMIVRLHDDEVWLQENPT